MIDQLLKDIKANRCILFLGPLLEVFTDNNDKNKKVSHTELYCSTLVKNLVDSNIPFDRNAYGNPFYLAGKFLDGSEKNRLAEEAILNDVYKNKNRDADTSIYADLATIPFNTIINFGCDHLMDRALVKAGYQFQPAFYNYRGPQVENTNVEKEMPLVYNLLGSLEEPLSVIKNERQQLEFLRRINSSPRLPNDLLGRIKDDGKGPKSYIFLGFNFNEWPFRFLMDTLEIPKAIHRAITPAKSREQVAVMTRDFYTDRFGIDFKEQSPEDFLTELTAAYKNTIIEHRLGYISYDESDADIAGMFKLSLEASKITLRRGIEFFDRSLIDPAAIKAEVIEKNLAEASIFIFFASARSVGDPGIQHEVNRFIERYQQAMDDPEMKKQVPLIFPIIAKNCLWRDRFPDLEECASIILPGHDTVLKNFSRNPSDEDFVSMLETINTKIR